MARARNIKPAIMDNEALAELAPLTRLLFVYLWMLADREGRLEDRPKRIAAQALPYDRAADVGEMLDDLQASGFIKRYVAHGMACIQVLSFAKHQAPHGTEKDGTLPDEHGQYTVHIRGKNGYATGNISLANSCLTVKKPSNNALIPDSGLSDSGLRIPELTVAQAPVIPPKAKPKKPKPQKTTVPDGFGVSARVRVWAAEKGFSQLEDHLESFIRKSNAKAYEYVNWDDAFMEAIREDWAKLRVKPLNGFGRPDKSSTVPGRASDEFKPEPKLTPEQLAANRARAQEQLAKLQQNGLKGITQ